MTGIITINGNKYEAAAGETILQVAAKNKIFIPTMCYAKDLPPAGACGICVVEIEGSTRLLRACATPASDGMIIHTESERVQQARKTLLELTLSTHTGDCKAPCQLSCPAETDCKGYIALIAKGKTEEAVQLMKEAHPFPASLARICPRPCETGCRRKLVDSAVNIAGLKRYAADIHLQSKYQPVISPPTGKTVAIVGGGPAGLTAAYFLKRGGHDVVVFDQMPKMGGLLRYGIPEYRLPKAVLDAEVKMLADMGITFRNNVSFSKDTTLNELQKNYHAVVIAIGASASKCLWVKGEDSPGVIGGIDFLRDVASCQGNLPFTPNRPPLEENHFQRSVDSPSGSKTLDKILQSKRVIVIGGSNTAMDAARTAIRLGAEVFVSYRRTKEEMPAEQKEIEEAIAEGVQFLFLTAPKEISTAGGLNITLQKMTLGEPDESGRRRPVPMDDADEIIQADTIIAAIGQDVVTDGLEELTDLDVDQNFRTKLPGIYAIGDVTGKSSYAIDAIAHGRKVAASVLSTIDLPWDVIPSTIVKNDEKTEADFSHTPKETRQSETAHHTTDFSEVMQGLTARQAAQEAVRCLSCGCDAFDRCKLLKLANIYGANTEKFYGDSKIKHAIDERNIAIRRDINKCVHCYLCVQACKRIANKELFTAVVRGFPCHIDTAFGEALPHECSNCGECVKYCPTGALSSYGH